MRDDNRPVRPVRTYASLDAAYKHFNRHLFGGLLPSCIITLRRHKGAFGYFVAERMAELDDGEDQAVDEIALNPAAFEGRSPKDILSTLVHEMAHLWPHHYGTPGRVVRYQKRARNPLLVSAGFDKTDVAIPWLGGERLRLVFGRNQLGAPGGRDIK
jgi:hypothetical protein